MDLEAFADWLNVRVVLDVPDDGAWGAYCRRTRTIYLHPELSPLQKQYALAHELAHAYYGHTGCHPPWEQQADVAAAKALIRMSEWDYAIRIYDSLEAVADALDVHPRAVRALYHHLEEKKQ